MKRAYVLLAILVAMLMAFAISCQVSDGESPANPDDFQATGEGFKPGDTVQANAQSYDGFSKFGDEESTQVTATQLSSANVSVESSTTNPVHLLLSYEGKDIEVYKASDYVMKIVSSEPNSGKMASKADKEYELCTWMDKKEGELAYYQGAAKQSDSGIEILWGTTRFDATNGDKKEFDMLSKLYNDCKTVGDVASEVTEGAIDSEDFDKLSDYSWNPESTCYKDADGNGQAAFDSDGNLRKLSANGVTLYLNLNDPSPKAPTGVPREEPEKPADEGQPEKPADEGQPSSETEEASQIPLAYVDSSPDTDLAWQFGSIAFYSTTDVPIDSEDSTPAIGASKPDENDITEMLKAKGYAYTTIYPQLGCKGWILNCKPDMEDYLYDTHDYYFLGFAFDKDASVLKTYSGVEVMTTKPGEEPTDNGRHFSTIWYKNNLSVEDYRQYYPHSGEKDYPFTPFEVKYATGRSNGRNILIIYDGAGEDAKVAGVAYYDISKTWNGTTNEYDKYLILYRKDGTPVRFETPSGFVGSMWAEYGGTKVIDQIKAKKWEPFSEKARIGNSRPEIAVSSNAEEIKSDKDFEDKVLNSTGLVLVDFYDGGSWASMIHNLQLKQIKDDPTFSNVKLYRAYSFGDDRYSYQGSRWLQRGYAAPKKADLTWDSYNYGKVYGNDMFSWLVSNGGNRFVKDNVKVVADHNDSYLGNEFPSYATYRSYKLWNDWIRLLAYFTKISGIDGFESKMQGIRANSIENGAPYWKYGVKNYTVDIDEAIRFFNRETTRTPDELIVRDYAESLPSLLGDSNEKDAAGDKYNGTSLNPTNALTGVHRNSTMFVLFKNGSPVEGIDAWNAPAGVDTTVRDGDGDLIYGQFYPFYPLYEVEEVKAMINKYM